MISRRILASTLLAAGAALAQPASASHAPRRHAATSHAASAYVHAGTIPAPDDRWDFAAWDADHARVLVAHGHDVLVVDPKGAGSVMAIGSIGGAHQVLAVPGTDTILATSKADGTLRLLDEASGRQLASIPAGDDPDAAILSADHQTAYVMDAKGGAVFVIDLAARRQAGRIALKPALEVPVLASPTLLAVNDEDANEIELADLAAGKAAGTIALPGCEGPTGLALDPASGLALSACANGKAALVDLAARRQVALVPIGLGPDTVVWDGAHHRFLVPCGGSGTLSVIALHGRQPVVEPAATTEPSARTAAFDPASGRLYFPAARFEKAEPPAKRGRMVAGSFHLVVMAPRAG